MADSSLREHQRAAAKRRWADKTKDERAEALRPATEAAAAKRRRERIAAEVETWQLTDEQIQRIRDLFAPVDTNKADGGRDDV